MTPPVLEPLKSRSTSMLALVSGSLQLVFDESESQNNRGQD